MNEINHFIRHIFTGGSSVHFHMLNVESRKYFTRAYFSSSSAFSYIAINTTNHVQRMREFSKVDDMDKLIEYLKTTKSDVLEKCHTMDNFDMTLISSWVPTIENPDTIGAFMTETPEVTYKSGNVPMIDTMVSFTSKVRKVSMNTEYCKKCVIPFDHFVGIHFILSRFIGIDGSVDQR